MIDFFISYAREDVTYARALMERLTDNGWTVWIDEKDIPPSVPWMTEIQRSIDESMLVIVVESIDWLSSDACHIEASLAEKSRVPILRLAPDLNAVNEHAVHAANAFRNLPAWRVVALGAAAAAAVWDAAGRTRSLLTKGKALSQMRQGLRAHPEDFSPIATTYITASRRAASRRLAAGLIVSITVPVLVGAINVTLRVVNEVNTKVATNIADATKFSQRAAYHDWNTYAGLERASIAVSTSFSRYSELFNDLRDLTPSSWNREPVVEPGSLTATSPDGGGSATAAGSTIKVVLATGETRTLLASSPIDSIAWSPDGRWIAAATANGADVIAVMNGQVIVLAGGAGTSATVVWDDAQHVSVGGSAGTGTWEVFPGTSIATLDDGIRYGTQVDGMLYTVAASGRLTATGIDARTSQNVPWDVPSGAYPTSIDSTVGQVVVGFDASPSFLLVLDTATESTRQVPMPDCSPLGLSVTRDGRAAYVACADSSNNETRVDLKSGAVTSQPYQIQMAYGATALDDRVVWGGYAGGLFASNLDLTPQGLLTASAGCGAPTRKLVGASDGSQLFTVGDSTASYLCATRISIGADVQVNRLIFPSTDGHAVPDAAVSTDGSLVAYGLSDGQVRVFTTDGLEPILFSQVLPGQVRAISFNAEGDGLIVAGLDGEVVSVPLPFTTRAEGNTYLHDEALSRLQNALDWGIFSLTLDTSQTTPSAGASAASTRT